MDMFGGLTKTSSRIAIAAALGLTLGGFAFSATPARAADLGGDCCADLEERVAELEATTVRKGNKKVSVTLSGWVVKSMNYWDDGDLNSFVVGDKDADLTSRFAITGSATISPGWSAGYNITVTTPGFLAEGGDSDIFGLTSNQFNEFSAALDSINTLYSYIYVKSDTLGALNWGYLSPASDNPAVLADISGTVIESNGVWFEGAGFFLRPKGGGSGLAGLSGLRWADFIRCQGLGAGIGVDCFGDPQPAVRYDSPTWGGFRFETSYGTMEPGRDIIDGTPDSNFWDIAVFYTAEWNSIKLSAAAANTLIDTGALNQDEDQLFQVGASIMHKPSGLGIYGMYQREDPDGRNVASLAPTLLGVNFFDVNFVPGPFFVAAQGGAPFATFGNPETDAWYIKPFIRKAWSPIGHTVLYGEFGQYNDQFLGGRNLCFFGFGAGTNVGNFCGTNTLSTGVLGGVFATGSEAERWGLGVVQEIDSAAMHLWFRWQHQEIDVDMVGFSANNFGSATCTTGADVNTFNLSGCKFDRRRINQSFDDWDFIQFGGVLFF
jgi:hypothetical protein